MANPHSSDWLRASEAARYMKISKSKLDKDRCTGALGIPFTKVGRLILYNRLVLDDWLQRHQFKSTSEYQLK